jgi:hypothetical protein
LSLALKAVKTLDFQAVSPSPPLKTLLHPYDLYVYYMRKRIHIHHPVQKLIQISILTSSNNEKVHGITKATSDISIPNDDYQATHLTTAS